MCSKNNPPAQTLQDIISIDDYSYNVLPLDEFCEKPFDPQKGDDFELSNTYDAYQKFELEIEKMKIDAREMSISSTELPTSQDGSKNIPSLNSNGASIGSNSGISINHSVLNNCISIPQEDMLQSEQSTYVRNIDYTSTFPNQHKYHEETTQNSSFSSEQISLQPDMFQIESELDINESCSISLSFSDLAKVQLEKNMEPMVLIRSSELRKLISRDNEPFAEKEASILQHTFLQNQETVNRESNRCNDHRNMNPETSDSMNNKQQYLPSKFLYGIVSKSEDILQSNSKIIHHRELHSTNHNQNHFSHKNGSDKIIERLLEGENDQDEKNQAKGKDCKKSDLCKVCGDIASAHCHYGGKSCLGCRAFFRRSVKKYVKYPGFKYFCQCIEMCGKTGHLRCKPNKVTRNGCKYCRYKRCRESAGLVDEWVLSAYTPTVQNKKNYNNDKSSKKGRWENKLARKETSTSMEMEDSAPTINSEFLENMSKKYRKSFLHNPELIDTMKTLMTNKKQKITSEQKNKLEFFLSQEMQHIANEFEEFKKLTFDSQAMLLKDNNTTFSRINFLKFMFESVLEEEFDQDKLVLLYGILFNNSKKKLKNKSKDAWLNVRIDNAIHSMVTQVDKDRNMFKFMMPIILFSNSSLLKQSIDDDAIFDSQLNFMQQLHQYLLIQQRGNKKVAAVRFGIVNDLISRFREF